MSKSVRTIVVLVLLVPLFLQASSIVQARIPWPPPEDEPPALPVITSVQHSKTTTSVTATWSVTFSANSWHNWMKFYWRLAEGSWVDKCTWDPTSSATYSYSVTGLSPGNYEYKIVAWSENDGGQVSKEAGPYGVAVPYPDKPAIYAVQSSVQARSVTVSWKIIWDTSATGYLVKYYFGNTSSLTEADVVVVWLYSNTEFTYTTYPRLYGDSWYKIYAEASNQYGFNSAIQGPSNVVLNPPISSETVSAVEDCSVTSLSPNNNWNSGLLRAGTDQVGPRIGEIWTYLKFQLNGIRDITSCKLRIWCDEVVHDEAGHPPIRCSILTDTSWSEQSLTWNTRPQGGSSGQFLVQSVPEDDQWQEWDISSFVSAYENTTATIILRADWDGDNWANYASSENEVYAPRLALQGKYELEDIGVHYREDWLKVPKFVIYDPPGALSYQEITQGYSFEFTNTWSFDAEAMYLVRLIGGFSSWYSSSIKLEVGTTSAQSSDPKYVAFGGDWLICDEFQLKLTITGFRRVGFGWESFLFYVADAGERTQREGIWGYARADLTPETAPWCKDLRKVESTTRRDHFDWGPGASELRYSVDYTFQAGGSWYLGGGLCISGSYPVGPVSIGFKFELRLTASRRETATTTIKSVIHLKDPTQAMTGWINYPNGYPGNGLMHENIQDYVFWFNY